jgi:MFS family permease
VTVARAGRWLADVRPLREFPAFRRLWAGSTLSAVGGALTFFAVPLQVYDITRSSLAVGAIGLAEMVPTVTIGLLGGAIADAVDRRKLVLVLTGGSAAVSAGLAAQAFAGLGSVWLLYVLVAVSSSVSAINAPVRRTLIPSLLPADHLTAGLALNRLTFQIMLTAGPGLAGLITAAPGLGLRACYLIDAASFAGSLYGVAGLPALPRAAGAARPGPRAVAAGVRHIGRSRVLAGAFLADLCATIFGLPAALFPAINAERFGADPRTLGLFTAAIGVGGLLSAAFSGPAGHVTRQGRAMLGAVAVWGAAFAGFALATALWLTLVMLAIAGAADTFTVVFRGTIVQQTTPDEFRGRVTAADYVVGVSGGQLGNLEAGALGSLTSPVISALTGGLITVAGAAVIGVALPAFARYRPPEGSGGGDDELAEVEVTERDRAAGAGDGVDVDPGLRDGEQLEPVEQAGGGVPERAGAGVARKELRGGGPVGRDDRRGQARGLLVGQHGGGAWAVGGGDRDRGLVPGVQGPFVAERVGVRGQRGGDAEPVQQRAQPGQQLVPPGWVHEQEVEPVAHAEPVQAGLDQLLGQAEVGGHVDVQDRAAVGMGHGAHAVPGGLGGQGPGAVPAAAQDDQRDQAGLADQGPGRVLPGHPDQLDHRRVQPGLGQGGRDDLVGQRDGGTDGG